MSPVEKIANWINDKPIWWRHAVHCSLQKGKLSPIDLEEIYKVAMIEHGLLEEENIYHVAKQPINITGYETESSEVTIKSISQVINVGALAEDQLLEFQKKGLTVIYGDNGTGKSSYSRILKHACLARGSTPQILGNVFEISSAQSSAILTIDVDGNIEERNWNLKFTGDSALKAIRVFDSDVADHFVTSEDELGYKPTGLHLLEELTKAIEFVKNNVVEEVMPGNGLVTLPEFGDTKTGKFVKNLSYDVDMAQLDEFDVTSDEINSLDSLAKEISQLKAKSPAQLKKELTDKKRQVLPLKKFIDDSLFSLSDKVFHDIKLKKLDLNKKSEFAEQLREKLLGGLPLSGVGSSEWQIMWNAAEKFFITTGEDKSFPPASGDNCPLCLQVISHEASKKLAGFSEFLANQASQEAKNAKKLYSELRNNVLASNLEYSPYESAIAVVNESKHGFSDAFNDLIINLKDRKDIFTSETIPEEIKPISNETTDIIQFIIDQIDLTLSEISDDGSITEIINKKQQLFNEITDKKLFKCNLDHVKSNISRYRALKKFEALESQCKSRPVTDINSEICKKEVILPLVESFDDELRRFGFNRFKIKPKTRGKSGAQLLKLEIPECGESLVAKVASEGEQRCISIACFLAEMRADKRKSAVIFDDPVNSLSHQWSSRVAKRIVAESLNRQVIVLTHDIVFYKLLLEEVEYLDSATFNGICLERSQKKAGLVRSTPPWDALTTGKRIKQLEVMLRELRTIEEQETDREFRHHAYHFYGYLREAWERLVEEKLLNQVITRFGRSIQTTRLKRLVDITEDDLNLIETAMGKCSTYFRGHDSAPAVGDPYPTIVEIEADLAAISRFNTELQNTRKRN